MFIALKIQNTMSNSKLFCIFFVFLFLTTFASSNLNNIHKCSKEDSEALLLFKQNLPSINYTTDYLDYYPDGWVDVDEPCHWWLGSDYYPMKFKWNASTDCCNWNGVTCDRYTGDVIGIDLSCGMLKGSIHPNSSLFNLPHLKKLNLAFNYIGGSQIPSEIRRFSNSLTHLNLSWCKFSGQVPPDITLLHKLVSLDLSANSDLKLKPHVFINLIHNSTNWEELSLQDVSISSVLPTSLNISSSLKLLDLHHTGLQGKLPHYIFNLHSLETLDLSYNSFIGNIPSEISVNITHITYLNLARNKLNGTLPSWLFTFPSLEILRLSHNMLSGNVPFESFALPSLKEFYLSHNDQLVGHVEMQTFLKLTNLTDLGLSYNNFSGEWELDTLLITLTELEYLDLSYNGLSVTAENANHYVSPGFRYLGLASCNLKVFPPSICNMSHLYSLDISNNSIGGIIPECFGSRYLEGLILNGNQLEGEVPHSLSRCRSLKVLDLGNNKLNGTFPEWLRGLSNLQVLVLKSNNFHGPIGTSTAIEHAFSRLQVLDLSHNCFVGELPAKYFQTFKAMQKMVSNSTYPEYLSMGRSDYSMIVVVKDVQMTVTQLLVDYTIADLSNNRFEGEIPSVIGSLKSLKVLNLSHNNLNGEIPNALGNMLGIESLDLSWNQLIGQIPQSLADITALEVLNLSQNRLVGRIPQGNQFSTFDESSYGGNLGLCEFPLSNKCEQLSSPHVYGDGDEEEVDESGFTWKVVMLGYGCGTLVGLVMGYLMLSTRKVKWFNAIADATESLVLKKMKKKRRHIYIGK